MNTALLGLFDCQSNVPSCCATAQQLYSLSLGVRARGLRIPTIDHSVSLRQDSIQSVKFVWRGMACGAESSASAWQDWSWEKSLVFALMRIPPNVNLDVIELSVFTRCWKRFSYVRSSSGSRLADCRFPCQIGFSSISKRSFKALRISLRLSRAPRSYRRCRHQAHNLPSLRKLPNRICEPAKIFKRRSSGDSMLTRQQRGWLAPLLTVHNGRTGRRRSSIGCEQLLDERGVL